MHNTPSAISLSRWLLSQMPLLLLLFSTAVVDGNSALGSGESELIQAMEERAVSASHEHWNLFRQDEGSGDNDDLDPPGFWLSCANLACHSLPGPGVLHPSREAPLARAASRPQAARAPPFA